MSPKIVLNTAPNRIAIVAASVFAVPLVSATAAQAQQATLAAQAQTKAVEFRGQVGRLVTFICPGNVNIHQDIYGTDVYSDTSPISRPRHTRASSRPERARQ